MGGEPGRPRDGGVVVRTLLASRSFGLGEEAAEEEFRLRRVQARLQRSLRHRGHEGRGSLPETAQDESSRRQQRSTAAAFSVSTATTTTAAASYQQRVFLAATYIARAKTSAQYVRPESLWQLHASSAVNADATTAVPVSSTAFQRGAGGAASVSTHATSHSATARRRKRRRRTTTTDAIIRSSE